MHYFLLILTVLFWSGNFIVGRGIHNEIPPATLAFWRWTVALLIILPFSVGHIINQKDLIRQNWKIITLLAILSVTSFSIFYIPCPEILYSNQHSINKLNDPHIYRYRFLVGI